MAVSPTNNFNRARLDDRQVTELIGIARGLIADDALSDAEIVFLLRWLAANEGITENPMIAQLSSRLVEATRDGIIDDEERAALFFFLRELTGNDFEVGEVLKATSLPLCRPPPDVTFTNARFCFTGTFMFGSRADCERAVADRGGQAGSLTRQTRYLVIGEYATDSWAQSSWGRKIEQAVQLRESGVPISIVSEQHWRAAL